MEESRICWINGHNRTLKHRIHRRRLPETSLSMELSTMERLQSLSIHSAKPELISVLDVLW